MDKNCIFCKIVNKEIQSSIAYEDENLIAFHDLNPVSPVHILFIPKKHIKSLNEITKEDSNLLGNILFKISDYAKEHGYSDEGYRVVNNIGRGGGQTVYHIHFHFLSGRLHGWPPG